jgi:hypothetical protein
MNDQSGRIAADSAGHEIVAYNVVSADDDPAVGPKRFPGISMRVRVSAQMGVMTEMPDSPLLRKPHCVVSSR